MTSVLIRRGKITQTQKEDSYVKTETEIGVVLPQAKEHLGLSEAGRGKGSSPRNFRRSMSLIKL